MKWYVFPFIGAAISAFELMNVFSNGSCSSVINFTCQATKPYELEDKVCELLICNTNVLCGDLTCANGKFYPCGQ